MTPGRRRQLSLSAPGRGCWWCRTVSNQAPSPGRSRRVPGCAADDAAAGGRVPGRAGACLPPCWTPSGRTRPGGCPPARAGVRGLAPVSGLPVENQGHYGTFGCAARPALCDARARPAQVNVRVFAVLMATGIPGRTPICAGANLNLAPSANAQGVGVGIVRFFGILEGFGQLQTFGTAKPGALCPGPLSRHLSRSPPCRRR